MSYILEFVIENEGCSIDDIKNAYPEKRNLERHVIHLHESNRIDAQLRYKNMIDGDVPMFGYIRSTPEGRGWLERTRAQWRRMT